MRMNVSSVLPNLARTVVQSSLKEEGSKFVNMEWNMRNAASMPGALKKTQARHTRKKMQIVFANFTQRLFLVSALLGGG